MKYEYILDKHMCITLEITSSLVFKKQIIYIHNPKSLTTQTNIYTKFFFLMAHLHPPPLLFEKLKLPRSISSILLYSHETFYNQRQQLEDMICAIQAIGVGDW